jgi:hypothetical protein
MKMTKGPKNEMVIPDMVKNIAPITIPQMQFGQGFISGWLHNKKLKQLEAESATLANIARDKNVALKNWLDTMRQMQTYMARIRLEFKEKKAA